MSKRKTTAEFIQEAKQIHGNKYDYSKVNYINGSSKICIICPTHGEFWQNARSHLKGHGCPKCNGGIKSTTEDFIKKAKKLYNNKYDYSKVKYINNYTKVCIICPEHGEFWTTPNTHLDNHACPKCSNLIKNHNKYSLEDFIDKANKIHNNRYSYKKVHYINNKTHVIITCPIHGDFKQRPDKHLIGQGCPKCNHSHGENEVERILISNNIKYECQHVIEIDKNINPSGKAYIDFYLPDYNIFIEYNGEQHYVNRKHFGGRIDFERQKDRDIFVRNYCKENNIRLLEIPYTENNIQECIINFINNLND